MSDLNVKEGDEVIQYKGHYGEIYIKKVVKITPTGIIVLDSEDRYKPNGQLKGGDSWNYSRITEVTPELRTAATRQKNIYTLKNIDWKKVDNETLSQIVALLSKE